MNSGLFDRKPPAAAPPPDPAAGDGGDSGLFPTPKPLAAMPAPLGGTLPPAAPAEAGSGLFPAPKPVAPVAGHVGQHQDVVTAAAGQYGLDPAMFSRLVMTESSGNAGARSVVGAMGLTQLMAATAKGLGVSNPFDPTQNAQGGAKYLRQLIDQFGGDTRKALWAYNWGPGNVRSGKPIPASVQAYADRILAGGAASTQARPMVPQIPPSLRSGAQRAAATAQRHDFAKDLATFLGPGQLGAPPKPQKGYDPFADVRDAQGQIDPVKLLQSGPTRARVKWNGTVWNGDPFEVSDLPMSRLEFQKAVDLDRNDVVLRDGSTMPMQKARALVGKKTGVTSFQYSMPQADREELQQAFDYSGGGKAGPGATVGFNKGQQTAPTGLAVKELFDQTHYKDGHAITRSERIRGDVNAMTTKVASWIDGGTAEPSMLAQTLAGIPLFAANVGAELQTIGDPHETAEHIAGAATNLAAFAAGDVAAKALGELTVPMRSAIMRSLRKTDLGRIALGGNYEKAVETVATKYNLSRGKATQMVESLRAGDPSAVPHDIAEAVKGANAGPAPHALTKGVDANLRALDAQGSLRQVAYRTAPKRFRQAYAEYLEGMDPRITDHPEGRKALSAQIQNLFGVAARDADMATNVVAASRPVRTAVDGIPLRGRANPLDGNGRIIRSEGGAGTAAIRRTDNPIKPLAPAVTSGSETSGLSSGAKVSGVFAKVGGGDVGGTAGAVAEGSTDAAGLPVHVGGVASDASALPALKAPNLDGFKAQREAVELNATNRRDALGDSTVHYTPEEVRSLGDFWNTPGAVDSLDEGKAGSLWTRFNDALGKRDEIVAENSPARRLLDQIDDLGGAGGEALHAHATRLYQRALEDADAAGVKLSDDAATFLEHHQRRNAFNPLGELPKTEPAAIEAPEKVAKINQPVAELQEALPTPHRDAFRESVESLIPEGILTRGRAHDILAAQEARANAWAREGANRKPEDFYRLHTPDMRAVDAPVEPPPSGLLWRNVDPKDERLDPFSDSYDESLVRALHHDLFGKGAKMDGADLSDDALRDVHDELASRQIADHLQSTLDEGLTDRQHEQDVREIAKGSGVLRRAPSAAERRLQREEAARIAGLPAEERAAARQASTLDKARAGRGANYDDQWFPARKNANDRVLRDARNPLYGYDLSTVPEDKAREIYAYALEQGKNHSFVNGREFRAAKAGGFEPSIYTVDEVLTREFHPDDVLKPGFDSWGKVHVPRQFVAQWAENKLGQISEAKARQAARGLGLNDDEFRNVVRYFSDLAEDGIPTGNGRAAAEGGTDALASGLREGADAGGSVAGETRPSVTLEQRGNQGHDGFRNDPDEYAKAQLQGVKKGKPGLSATSLEGGQPAFVFRDESGRAVGVLRYSGEAITDIAVNKASRGQGVAQTLIDAAKGAGVSKARGPFTDASYSLFERNGLIDALDQTNKGKLQGRITFTEGEKPVVELIRDEANVSTVLHELAHAWRRTLPEGDLEILAGHYGDFATTEAEERFARGVERYFKDGVAPVAELKGVFDRFRIWLGDIYRKVKGSPIEEEVHPDVRSVLDRALGGGEPIAETKPREALKVEYPNRALEDPPVYAGSNAAGNDLREAVGLDALPDTPTLRTTPDEARVGFDPEKTLTRARRIVADVANGDKAPVFSEEEQLHMGMLKAATGRRFNQLSTRRAALIEAGESTADVDELLTRAQSDVDAATLADKYAGTEWGRAGQARNTAIADDYTAAGLYRSWVNAAKVPLGDADRQEAQRLAGLLAEAEDRITNAEAEAALSGRGRARGRRGGGSPSRRSVDELRSSRADATARIKEKIAARAKNAAGRANSFGALGYEVASGFYEIAPDIVQVAKDFAEEGATVLADVIVKVREHLKAEAGLDLSDDDVMAALSGRYERPKVDRSKAATQLSAWRNELSEARKKAGAAERALAAAERDDLRQQTREQSETQRKAEKEAAYWNRLAEGAEKRKAFEQERIARDKAAKAEAAVKKEKGDAINADRKARRKEYEAFFGEQSRLEKSIADLQAKIAADDYTRKAKRTEDPTLKKLYIDREVLKIKANERRAELEQAQARKDMTPLQRGIAEALNVPRSLVASTDLSAPLNQGAFVTYSHPVESLRAMGRMMNALRNEDVYKRVLGEVRADPHFDKAVASGLQISAFDFGDLRDPGGDLFLSKLLGHSLEVGSGNLRVGLNPIAASERAYGAYLNKLRMDMYSRMVSSAEDGFRIAGIPVAKGKDLTREQLKDVADWVNVATGAGTGDAANALKTWNRKVPVMFAPSYLVSRWQLSAGGPGRLIHLIKTNPNVAAQVVADYVRFLGMAGGVLTAATAAGAKVERDSRSTNFGKIKLQDGATVDPFGGILAPYRLSNQLLRGTKGANGVQKAQPSRTIGQYLGNKVQPILGAAFHVSEGKAFGRSYDVNTAKGRLNVAESFAPIFTQGAFEIAEDKKLSPQAKAALGILSLFGAGVQTK